MDKPEGLYHKYDVIRLDGSEKHEDCEYFVLDLTHDPFAWSALYSYAKACRHKYPKLADDLGKVLNGRSIQAVIDEGG